MCELNDLATVHVDDESFDMNMTPENMYLRVKWKAVQHLGVSDMSMLRLIKLIEQHFSGAAPINAPGLMQQAEKLNS